MQGELHSVRLTPSPSNKKVQNSLFARVFSSRNSSCVRLATGPSDDRTACQSRVTHWIISQIGEVHRQVHRRRKLLQNTIGMTSSKASNEFLCYGCEKGSDNQTITNKTGIWNIWVRRLMYFCLLSDRIGGLSCLSLVGSCPRKHTLTIASDNERAPPGEPEPIMIYKKHCTIQLELVRKKTRVF